MNGLHPTVMFPEASAHGGVERIVLESLRRLTPRHPTRFVGWTLDPGGSDLQVEHVRPEVPRWSRGALRPVGFRVAATPHARNGPASVSVSYGVEAPAGDVYVVNSVHRAWLAVGGQVELHGVRIPNAARYLLPRHQVLLGLEWDYFRRHHPRRIVAVSDVVAHDLARCYGVDLAEVSILPNGFDRAVCDPARVTALRADERATLGISDDTLVVLFVANELHRKGFETLVRATARIPGDRIHVHVVGRTPLDDYEPLIQSVGLSHRVHYHGSTSDIGRAHAIADLLVLPTQYEAFALTIVEALASGIPVITTDVPGARDRIRPDENGLLLGKPRDDEELAALLVDASDDDRRARWAAAAPASVADLEWSTLMARLEQMLLEVA